MKRWLLFGFMAALFAGSAAASVTTYHWNETSSSPSGVSFHGSYSWVDGSAPVSANSTEASPNFGGLISLDIYGANLTPVTLADLVPTCAGCTAPIWNLSVSGGDLTMTYAGQNDGYVVSSNTIQGGSDQNDPCFSNICTSNGSWEAAVPSSVPMPATLPVFAAALLLFGFFRVRSSRIRS